MWPGGWGYVRSVITSNSSEQVSLLTKQGLVITSPICRTFVDEATVGRDVKDETARVKRGLRPARGYLVIIQAVPSARVCIIFALMDRRSSTPISCDTLELELASFAYRSDVKSLRRSCSIATELSQLSTELSKYEVRDTGVSGVIFES